MYAHSDYSQYVDILLEHGASLQAQVECSMTAVQTVIIRNRRDGSKVCTEDVELMQRFLWYVRSRKYTFPQIKLCDIM